MPDDPASPGDSGGPGGDAPGGLRERKKLRTRAAIEAAALSLFAQHGFDATTVEQIAAAAEISPRTFFHYFPTKEDVVLADYADRLERIVAVLGDRPADEAPLAAVKSAFLTVAADYEDQRDELLPRFRLMVESPSVLERSLRLQGEWEEAVATTLVRRLGSAVDPDLLAHLIAGAALAAMRASLRRWLLAGGTGNLPEQVAVCFDLLAAGLDPERGP